MSRLHIRGPTKLARASHSPAGRPRMLAHPQFEGVTFSVRKPQHAHTSHRAYARRWVLTLHVLLAETVVPLPANACALQRRGLVSLLAKSITRCRCHAFTFADQPSWLVPLRRAHNARRTFTHLPAGQGCSHILSSKKGRSQSESRSTLARLTTLARGDRCSHSTSY
jgi:hypothetical protein